MNNQRRDDDVTTQSDNSVKTVRPSLVGVRVDTRCDLPIAKMTPQSRGRHKRHDVTIDIALHQSESDQNGFPYGKLSIDPDWPFLRNLKS